MVILVQFQIILVAAGVMHMIEGRHQINVQDKHYPNKPESLIFILAAVLMKHYCAKPSAAIK